MNRPACLSVTAVLTLLMAGCSGGNAEDDSADTPPPELAEAVAWIEEFEDQGAEAIQARDEATEEAERQEEAAETCETKSDPLVGALQQLNSRLGVGMNLLDYTTYLGDVQVEYDVYFADESAFADDPQGALDCTLTAVGLEVALNRYVEAHQIWSDCIDAYGCSIDDADTDTEMQAAWSQAGTALSSSVTSIADLEPEPIAPSQIRRSCDELGDSIPSAPERASGYQAEWDSYARSVFTIVGLPSARPFVTPYALAAMRVAVADEGSLSDTIDDFEIEVEHLSSACEALGEDRISW